MEKNGHQIHLVQGRLLAEPRLVDHDGYDLEPNRLPRLVYRYNLCQQDNLGNSESEHPEEMRVKSRIINEIDRTLTRCKITTSPKSAVGNHSTWCLVKQLIFRPEGFVSYTLGSTIWTKRIQSKENSHLLSMARHNNSPPL